MSKKIYLTPETTVVDVELQLMNEFSGQGTDNVKVDGTADDTDEDSRSRSHLNVWGDDEEY